VFVVDFEMSRSSSRNAERRLRVTTRIDIEIISVMLSNKLVEIGRINATNLARMVLRRHDGIEKTARTLGRPSLPSSTASDFRVRVNSSRAASSKSIRSNSYNRVRGPNS
jgi:hypothetical protein